MSKRLDIYKCEEGLIVEILHGDCSEAPCPVLSCSGEPMELQETNTVDASREKHVPVLETVEDSVLVKVGSEPHPMKESHYIMWIEIINGDYVNRKYLHPGDEPEAAFYIGKKEGFTLRAYCNLHGLWEHKI
jgi:superoxide reductase